MKQFKLEVTAEELRTAWSRLKANHQSRCFTDHPHLLSWIEQDLDEWLEELRQELAAGYSPRPSVVCWRPKPNALLRPGAVLDVADEVVYNLLVGRFMPALHRCLSSFQGDPDVAYPVAKTADDVKWTQPGFKVWRNRKST